MSQVLTFEIEHAQKYGIPGAIILYHIRYWIEFNHADNRNRIEGRTWTFQSLKAMVAHFPFWGISSLQEHLKKLCSDNGPLIKGNFNKNHFDKTMWYSFKNEDEWIRGTYQKANKISCDSISGKPEIDDRLPERQISGKPEVRFPENRTPIPDNKEDDDKDNEKKERACAPPASLKKYFAKHVEMEQEEYDKLISKHGKEKIEEYIERLNDYIASQGKDKYKDHAATIRNWLRNADEKSPEVKNIISQEEQNQSLATKILARYPTHKEIVYGYNYIEFIAGSIVERIPFSDFGFRDKVLGNLRKRNLPVGGL